MTITSTGPTHDRSATETAEPGSIRRLIADTLDLDPADITAGLGLHQVPEWSSLDHVTLMLALERLVGRPIDGPTTASLTTVAAIEAWAAAEPVEPVETIDLDGPTIHRGLDGIYVDTTRLAAIDGSAGTLQIRGHAIEDLAADGDLTDVCHLVLFGERPDQEQRATTGARLLSPPALRPDVEQVFDRWHDHHPMVALRSAISLLGRADPEGRVPSGEAAIDRGLTLTAWSHQLLARHLAANLDPAGNGRAAGPDIGAGDADRGGPADPARRFAVAERFLQRWRRDQPDPLESEALDLVWRLQTEHGSNASAFAARVTAAAGTDVDAAIVTGLATFAGALHGGAVQGVIEGLRDIGRPERAAAWVEDRRARRQPIMGYGHRVYQVADPRSAPLRAMAMRLADHKNDHWAIDVVGALDEAMAEYERAGLGMNVDSYSSVLYHLLGFPDAYHTALYAVARSIGWVAHVAEQVERNVLIRPRLAYDGPSDRPWVVSTGGGERR